MGKQCDTYHAPGGRDKIADDISKLRLTAFPTSQPAQIREAVRC